MSLLLIDSLYGRPTPRRPVWLMRQAGRYLPEYRALRKDHTFEELSGSSELSCEVTLQPLRRFPLDAAIIFADLMSPVPSLGVPVRFAPGPVVDTPIASRSQIEALRRPSREEVAPEVARALALVKPELPDGCALIGFAGAPLSIAAYMVQGSGKKSFPALRALAWSDETAFHMLMERLVETCAVYMEAQVHAGADALQIFDSWGGLFSLPEWERLVKRHLVALYEATAHLGVPRIGYFQGSYHLLDGLFDLPVEAFALDWRVDLGELRRQGVTAALQGNIDPAILLAGPEATTRATRALLASVPSQGHVVNLGQGLMPSTPIESVAAMVETVQAEGL